LQSVGVELHKTSLFLTDYREIILEIADANPDAAERLCDAVESALKLLSQHPQIARKAGFAHAPKVRRWVLQSFPNYSIYYKDHPGEIVLIRLLHGARDAPPLIHRHKNRVGFSLQKFSGKSG